MAFYDYDSYKVLFFGKWTVPKKVKDISLTNIKIILNSKLNRKYIYRITGLKKELWVSIICIVNNTMCLECWIMLSVTYL